VRYEIFLEAYLQSDAAISVLAAGRFIYDADDPADPVGQPANDVRSGFV